MIRTVWFYVVLVVSGVIHAGGVLVASLVGVKRRPGGVYDWGASDWGRDVIAAAGTPVELEGRERIPPHRARRPPQDTDVHDVALRTDEVAPQHVRANAPRSRADPRHDLSCRSDVAGTA